MLAVQWSHSQRPTPQAARRAPWLPARVITRTCEGRHFQGRARPARQSGTEGHELHMYPDSGYCTSEEQLSRLANLLELMS